MFLLEEYADLIHCMVPIREKITDLIQSIKPLDELEKSHQKDVLHWIKSGVEIFRVEKPDKPLC